MERIWNKFIPLDKKLSNGTSKQSNTPLKRKVFVGISGGVDSSVALALLQKATPNNFSKLFGRPTPKGFRGYDVTGVFLKGWYPDWMPCNWKEERRSAMRVCATLGVPFMTIDCEKKYKKEVVDYMISEYSAGRVPNPDIFCNKYIKFGLFLKKAIEMGADFIATGHYATRIVRTRPNGLSSGRIGSNNTNIYELHESIDKEKDQSYFLYTLNQEQLKHTLFPVGGMTKPDVRILARKFGLPTAEKKDSQGICFLGKLDMKEFLSHYIDNKPGDVISTSDVVIGRHNGAMFYTIGQRHGFAITKKGTNDHGYFVVSKDLKKNTITVTDKKSQADSYSTKKIILKNIHFICEGPSFTNFPMKTYVRIRYRQEKQKCKIEKIGKNYHVTFDKPQTGVSVGQSAVFYGCEDCEGRSFTNFTNKMAETCLGGGIIESTM